MHLCAFLFVGWTKSPHIEDKMALMNVCDSTSVTSGKFFDVKKEKNPTASLHQSDRERFRQMITPHNVVEGTPPRGKLQSCRE
jgi:hypothetical protein